MLLLSFCLLTALTQFVNPFPHDGWFHSQSLIFTRSPGADNYTPIAVPAFFYASVHGIARVAGWGLKAEFYLASFLHHVLLFLTGLLLYLSHRCLGLPKAGLVTSVFVVVFVESTLIPRSFWSENLTIFLMSAILFTGIYLLVNPDLDGRRFRWLTVLFGLLLGAFVVTRVIPLLILPALILLFRVVLPRDRIAQFAVLSTALVSGLVLLSMSANLLRFGRFELSNSVGRHLWNVISPRADQMLAGSREYQLLKRTMPDVQGRPWWEVANSSKVPELKSFTHEGLLRKLALDAISAQPVLFVKLGAKNARKLLSGCPGRIGLIRAEYYNPLKRETMLPALVHPFPPLENALAAFHQFVSRNYRSLMCATLLLGGVAFAAGTAFPARVKKGSLYRRVWLFSISVFLASIYLSGQIELPDVRYVVPYLPVFALMASTGLGMLAELAPPANMRRRFCKMAVPPLPRRV